MPKVSRTYRIDKETAGKIAEIAEHEKMTATEVVEAAIRLYFSEKYAENTAKLTIEGDSQALSVLVEQLAVKDEQISKLTEALADSTKAIQGAQVLHHETAQASMALESPEQKKSRWKRLRDAWHG